MLHHRDDIDKCLAIKSGLGLLSAHAVDLEKSQRISESRSPLLQRQPYFTAAARCLIVHGPTVERRAPLFRDAVAKAVNNPNVGDRHQAAMLYAANHAKCLDSLGRHDEAAELRKQFGLPEAATRPATNPA